MNKAVRIAMDIVADYRYVYDPEHDDKPAGMWNRTNSGWSQNNGEDGGVSQPKPRHESSPEKPSKPAAPAKPEKQEPSLDLTQKETTKPSKPSSEGSLFDEDADDDFVTDEDGKEEEQEATVPEEPAEPAKPATEDGDSDEPGTENEDEDGSDEEEGLDLGLDEDGAEQEDGEGGLDLGEKEGEGGPDGESDEDVDDGIFDEANKETYIDADKYDQYIEQMNSFIEKFDEGEGKENDVTFKAIASNLDWDSMGEVKAFAEHCREKGLEGAGEVLAFLYFQHQEDGEKFDKIVADMK